jgi:tetratricopeptide (TPR) repeat protein
MRKTFVLFWGGLCLLSLAGCQRSQAPAVTATKAPADYAYADVQGPSVEDEIKFYEERVKQRPASWADKVFLANAYLGKAQAEDNDELFDKAQQIARDVIKVRPQGTTGAHLVLAQVAEGHHNFKEAYEICHKLYEQDRNDVTLYPMISNSLLEMGRVKEAAQWSAPVVQAASGSGAFVHAARVAIYNGNDEEAVKHLQAALKLEQPQERKTSARIRSLWGDIHLRHGRLAEAREMLEASLKIQKRSLPALLALARLERREGHPDKALQLLTEAYGYFHNPAILTEMAAMEDKLGHKDKAEKLRAEAAGVLHEEVGEGMIGHARDLGKVLLDQGKAQEALKVLQHEQTYRSDHRNFELQAMAYEALKQPKEALTAMEKAMQNGYQDPAFYARAARLAEQAGDPRATEWQAKQKELDAGFSLEQ